MENHLSDLGNFIPWIADDVSFLGNRISDLGNVAGQMSDKERLPVDEGKLQSGEGK